MDFAKWVAYLSVVKTIDALPIKFIIPIAWTVGKLSARRPSAGSGYTKKLGRFLPDYPPDTGKKHCAQLHVLFCERTKYPAYITETGIDNMFEIHGMENLNAALEKGNGVIMTGAHFGPFEIGFLYLARCGYKLHIHRAVTDRNNALSMVRSTFFKRQIARAKMNIFGKTKVDMIMHRPEKSYLDFFTDLLAANELIMIFPEASKTARFIDAPFFDGTLRLATGFAFIAWKTGAPVVSLFCKREGKKNHLYIDEPYYVKGKDIDTATAIQEATFRFATLLESFVRELPEQWYLLQHLQLEANKDGSCRLASKTDPNEMYYDLAREQL